MRLSQNGPFVFNLNDIIYIIVYHQSDLELKLQTLKWTRDGILICEENFWKGGSKKTNKWHARPVKD